MEKAEYLHKVQYYETDQMGVVHHSNYIRWFEESRIDFLEESGLSYSLMERDGIISPVTGVECKYRSPVKFGDSVYIHTKIDSFNGITFSLSYRVTDTSTGKLRAEGSSSHCFINKKGNLMSLKKENETYYHLFSKLFESK
ncbi:MAG: acyl-CoA thioesterase [Sedimentibacter sp.]|uniref:acyl-CoA thioesterase n=1 Tax=Sedimentibacter sp. TaxID=1960295 RepID=UPI00315984C0